MARTFAGAGRVGAAGAFIVPRWCSVVAAAVVLALAAARDAGAGTVIVSEGVVVDRAAGSARFWMRLDTPPDFTTVDEFGRRAESFQYEVDGDWAGGLPFIPFSEVDAVVRGDELDELVNGGDWTVPIRAAGAGVEPDPDPNAGGWGPVVTSVPLHVDGSEVSFQAPLNVFGDDDGVFAYRVFTTEFGGTVSHVESSSVTPPAVIPLPAALWPALATAAGCAAVAVARRRRGKLHRHDLQRR